MSATIPGGRQRTASEGDIIDYNNDTITNGFGHTELSTEDIALSTSAFHTLPRRQTVTTSDTDHDSNASVSTLERKSKSRLQPLRAVKKSVARMVRQAVFSVSSSGQNDTTKDGKHRYNIKAIVTPTFGRKSKYAMKNENSNNNVSEKPLSFKPEFNKWPGDVTPGTLGLKNHGNTCFMNAVLQCLSNTDVLTEYFATDKYKDDLLKASAKLNVKKYYGANGEITKQLATLLQSLWTQRYSPGVTEKFKSVIGKCNNQYVGSSQHDAQEFLLWLLDKLHEDLCLVLKKKKIKSPSPCPDDEPGPDLLTQNKSFVNNTFQALHRSSLTCQNCKRNSNTFEPYVCVSLPLPQKSVRPVIVTVVMLTSQPRQVKIALSLDAFGTIADLRARICSDTKTPDSQLLIVQYYDDGWRQTYTDEQPLSDIPDSETVYAIELLKPPPPSEYDPSPLQVVLINVERVTNPSRCIPFCGPEVMNITRDISFTNLQTRIIEQMGASVNQTATEQKDEQLFELRVADGIPSKPYLSPNVDMPLYTETVDEALLRADEKLPPHLKLIIEWDRATMDKYVLDTSDFVKEHSNVNQIKQTAPNTTTVSLDECFDLYTREEKLSGEDAWLCPYCKQQQLGTIKKLGLWSLPDIFVIHLKRFRQIGHRRNKLNTLVSFPVTSLDMSRHVIHKNNNKPGFTSQESYSPSSNQYENDDVYDLYAVCNHYGNMQGGHYTAVCRNSLDKKWYSFDDSNVRLITDNRIASNSAYILFYQRRSLTRKSQSLLETGHHWIYHLSKINLSDLPIAEPDRANKPLPLTPKESPFRTPPVTKRRTEDDDDCRIVTPQRGRQISSSMPRQRREHSAPAHSNRAPLTSATTNVKLRGNTNTQDSPRLRRHSSERRSDQNLSRSSWLRHSGEFRATKAGDNIQRYDQNDGSKDRVTFESRDVKLLNNNNNRLKPVQFIEDYAENLSVALPPSQKSPPQKSPNQKGNDNPITIIATTPKSILKSPSTKFDTLPRQKSTTPDKTITISESKSVYGLSSISQGNTPIKGLPKTASDQTLSKTNKQLSPIPVNKKSSTVNGNKDLSSYYKTDIKSNGTIHTGLLHPKDSTVFEIRRPNNHVTSSRSSSGSEGYVSARNSSTSDYHSPRSSYSSSPKSPHEDGYKTVRIVDDKPINRALFPSQQPTRTSHGYMPGSAYSYTRPLTQSVNRSHPQPINRPHTNGNQSHFEKPPPPPTPPRFDPFSKKPKVKKSDFRQSADSNSLDRYSTFSGSVSNGGYTARVNRVPSRLVQNDQSCLKESSV